ncbi:MAG: hypothetical protein AAFO79_10055, partial [Pseudomonadota bacterium]
PAAVELATGQPVKTSPPPNILTAWPAAMTEPIGTYVAHAAVARRALRAAALAHFAGNKEHAARSLDLLPADGWHWLRHQIDLKQIIDNASQLHRGLTQSTAGDQLAEQALYNQIESDLIRHGCR